MQNALVVSQKRPHQDGFVKVSRQTVDGNPLSAKYRFTWGDGCFFTMLVTTVRGPTKDKDAKIGWKWDETDSIEPVTPDAAECWLWVRLADRMDYDPKYDEGEFPKDQADFIGGEDARLGIWSIAFNLNGISNGETDAIFVNEWWKEIQSTSCTGRRMIVIRYIIATQKILSMHVPSITRVPALQSAVCDPLKWNGADNVPDFDGTIDTSRIQNLNDIYQTLLKGGFADDDTSFISQTDGTWRIGAMSRPLARKYGFKVDQIRKAALSELFNKGAWRLKYFERLGGEFNLNESNRKTIKLFKRPDDTYESVLQRLFATLLQQENLSGFAKSVKEACDDEAKRAYLAYEEWVNLKPGERDQSDASFAQWFRETYYIAVPEEANGTTISSKHPLHLKPFTLDVCKSAALLIAKHDKEVWMQRMSVEFVSGGTSAKN